MTKIPIRSHGLSVRRSAVSLLLQLLIDFPGGEAEREREREREREPAYGPTADTATAAAAAVETAQGKWQ